jgi:hypothetical protein
MFVHRTVSSVGRAPALQAGCRGFKSLTVHSAQTAAFAAVFAFSGLRQPVVGNRSCCWPDIPQREVCRSRPDPCGALSRDVSALAAVEFNAIATSETTALLSCQGSLGKSGEASEGWVSRFRVRVGGGLARLDISISDWTGLFCHRCGTR